MQQRDVGGQRQLDAHDAGGDIFEERLRFVIELIEQRASGWRRVRDLRRGERGEERNGERGYPSGTGQDVLIGLRVGHAAKAADVLEAVKIRNAVEFISSGSGLRRPEPRGQIVGPVPGNQILSPQ